jgi:CheY-like chemotaxis protein/HPt (histidine-containing phosphotransfer) domain-containing protein
MLGFSSQADAVSLLIVDDDEVSRDLLATMFSIKGYAVRTAQDGGEAVALLGVGGYRPRVILMDLRMPGLNGANLISELRTRVRVGAGTAILAMSASEPRGSAADGADGFLRKPFGPEELEQALARSEHEATKSEQPETNAAPVLNRRKLEQLRAMMPETAVQQIYMTAIGDLHRKMPELEAAIQRGDAKAVHHMGHGMKGGCGMVGAEEAARLGALLEDEGNELDNSAGILAQLHTAINNLEDILKKEFPLM